MIRALEALRKGDCVKYRQTDWFVAARDVCKESEDYQETQWTLTARNRKTLYLICSEERKDAGLEVLWILTQQILLAGVQYQASPDHWEAFSENDFVTSPPPAVRLGQTIMNFDGETSGLAKDDEGQTVTKVTWDYFDDGKARNVAIEIWKEPDGDYPEAYEGTVVQPSEFEVLSDEARRSVIHKVKPMAKEASGIFWTAGGVGLFLFIAGLPFDHLLAGIVPVLAIIVLIQTSSAYWILAAGLTWLMLGALAILSHFIGASFWGVALAALAVSVLAPRLAALSNPDFAEEGSGMIFFANLLPPLWIYSFFTYFTFAPGPHELYQLVAACLLPVAITAVAYLASRFFRYGPK